MEHAPCGNADLAECDAAPAFADPGQPKVTICHGSARDYVVISVDANALNGHFDGTDPGHGARNLPDGFLADDGTCTGPVVDST